MHTAHLLSVTVCDMSPGAVTGTAAHSAVTKFGISGKGAELESNPKSTVLAEVGVNKISQTLTIDTHIHRPQPRVEKSPFNKGVAMKF